MNKPLPQVANKDYRSNFDRTFSKEKKQGKTLLVREDDDGIRPAGKKDECFYCNKKIGQFHREDCVIIVKLIKIKCVFKDESYFIAIDSVPYSWTLDNILFRYEGSSYCCDSLLGNVWTKSNCLPRSELKDHYEGSDVSCMCFDCEFEYLGVAEEGIFYSDEIRNKTTPTKDSLEA